MSAIDSVRLNGVTHEISQEIVENYGLSHNGIFRGKSLGTISSATIGTFLSDHNVASGKFTDLYLGDEVVIQDGTYNATWIVAGFDTEWNKGDTAMTTHHVSLIPKGTLLNAQMNSSNTTSGGYAGSAMNTTTIPTVVSKLNNALSTHLLNRRVLLSNAASTTGTSMAGAGLTGYASGWAWNDAKATLLTEVQVYGSTVCSSSFYDVGEGCEKLPVFNFISPSIRAAWWLRAVASSTYFAIVNGSGSADYDNASDSLGVRPLICIG